MALSVDKVYRFVQFVANKEMRGWIAPGEFNISAELAQINAYSKREAVFIQTKKILNDLRPFIKTSTEGNTNGLVTYPAGLRHFVTARVVSNGRKIVELTQAELGDVLDSTIVPPTTERPACVQRDNGIQLYPITYSPDVELEYLIAPTAPLWAYTGTRPVYDSENSTDFEVDDILFLEIATHILMNVGVNLKDENVTQYGMAFNKSA